MDFAYTDTQNEIRGAVRRICDGFGLDYWRRCDEDGAYPKDFVKAMTESGWLASLIPEAYGGSGLSLLDACVVLEEINRSGGNAAACHAQMYTMASILRHGSEAQKQKYLPLIADGRLRLQAFGVTEPDAGSNTLRIKTTAKKAPGGYRITGQKIWTSRFLFSDLYLLLARTTPPNQLARKTEGLSLFLIDIAAAGETIKGTPIRTMLNHHTCQVFLDGVFVPEENLIGEEGKGFSYIVDSLNAERLLVASESVGDGKWFVETASRYASERTVFDRLIGANQGVQFPIAKAYVNVEAAELMRNKAATAFDLPGADGRDASMAKYLASEAAWEAAEAAMMAFGGYGFASEYHVERKWREARLYRTAPIANNLVLAQISQHVLGMPRSY